MKKTMKFALPLNVVVYSMMACVLVRALFSLTMWLFDGSITHVATAVILLGAQGLADASFYVLNLILFALCIFEAPFRSHDVAEESSATDKDADEEVIELTEEVK